MEAAVADGAQMLALPEAFGLMERDRERALAQVVASEQDPFIGMSGVRCKVWLMDTSRFNTGIRPQRKVSKSCNHD